MQCVQIIGYKNRGKTTLVEHLVAFFSKYHYQVAAIKHHGHGGPPLGWEKTDNAKHLQAGADFAGVQGENLLQIATNKEWNLDVIIQLYTLLNVDILFIEGYKHEPKPKIVLIGEQEDTHLLNKVSNLKAVVSSIPLEDISVPIFKPVQLEKLAYWLLEQYKQNLLH
ncbi:MULTISPECIES: molybdopterin-guanine dinucleotide biosynthesis protein B [Niallia]|jgi:molybdopterin-guanine dinucleotide biosynthesis adapter protein|uniref:Molybdopterin-guanine dinucleotide biosynthesis protein B (MobB) domain-containing protein n=1 Tax=Niallia circulans TaxID=1397 RepID=A0A0J1INZ0_NIACI|nr:molybdopterin-guanine dinucleotide biosynthesis protein B [Niallia circulans]KLV27681.1 hypothetical protein ABW02_05930 [Niallia circulans]MED5101785.1 molybdopterin-guanine dinucleotide biosynthesis protein B [Niallia circulans]